MTPKVKKMIDDLNNHIADTMGKIDMTDGSDELEVAKYIVRSFVHHFEQSMKLLHVVTGGGDAMKDALATSMGNVQFKQVTEEELATMTKDENKTTRH